MISLCFTNNTFRMRTLFLVAALLLCATLRAPALNAASPHQDSAERSNARLDVAPQRITVGDPFALTLVITHPATEKIVPAALGNLWGPLEIIHQSIPETRTLANGSRTTTQRIEARLFEPGALVTPPLEYSRLGEDGRVAKGAVPGLRIEVHALIDGDVDSATLRAIKPQVNAVAEPPALWLPVGVALALLSVLGLAWDQLRRRSSTATTDQRTAAEIAFAALQEVEQQLQSGAIDALAAVHVLTACIRDYLGRVTGFPASSSTTAELAQILAHSNLPQELGSDYIEFLAQSDLVKFTRTQGEQEDVLHRAGYARQLIGRTENVLRQQMESAAARAHLPPVAVENGVRDV